MSRPSLFWCIGLFALPAETLARQVSAFYRTGNSSAPRGSGELHQLHKQISPHTRHVAGPQVCRPGLGRETFLFTTNQYLV